MARSVTQTRPSSYRLVARAAQARPMARPSRVSLGAVVRALVRVLAGALLMVAGALLGPGWFLDTPQPPPPASDAIVVISGDEQMARFQEGVNLYQRGLGKYL